MTKHNKKRNVGIVYELLLKYISNNLIEGNKKEAKKATKIIERNFKKGTELYKEFRLFNALATSKVSNTHTIASILSEAKQAARKFDMSKLDKEKSILIKDINYQLNKNFFYESLPNYRDLGTIQLALNEWRKSEPDIKNLVSFEGVIAENMLKKSENVVKENIDLSHSDRLVLKIMTEKFNQKYSEGLSKDQKMIIENYVFYKGKNDKKLTDFLNRKKLETVKAINIFEDKTSNKYLLKKIDDVRLKINEVSSNNIDDKSVVKFLTLTKLIDELKKGE
jgi:hypothetical protein